HNNVGIEARKGLLDTTEEGWDRVIAVDLKSMFLATQAAVPAMTRRGAGAVICVSSIAGLRGYGRTAYATAEAGVIGFVRSVAVQLGPKGIRVNAIAPGPVWTPMVQDLGPDARERRGRGPGPSASTRDRSEEHTSELQSRGHLVCRLLLEKKKH